MDLLNPKIAISNHLRACCCGHVAQYELHIASEQICICICNMYMYMEMHMFNIYIHIMEIRRFLGDVYSSNCHGLFLAKVFCKWKYWIFGLPWNGGRPQKMPWFSCGTWWQVIKIRGYSFSDPPVLSSSLIFPDLLIGSKCSKWYCPGFADVLFFFSSG